MQFSVLASNVSERRLRRGAGTECLYLLPCLRTSSKKVIYSQPSARSEVSIPALGGEGPLAGVGGFQPVFACILGII